MTDLTTYIKEKLGIWSPQYNLKGIEKDIQHRLNKAAEGSDPHTYRNIDETLFDFWSIADDNEKHNTYIVSAAMETNLRSEDMNTFLDDLIHELDSNSIEIASDAETGTLEITALYTSTDPTTVFSMFKHEIRAAFDRHNHAQPHIRRYGLIC